MLQPPSSDEFIEIKYKYKKKRKLCTLSTTPLLPACLRLHCCSHLCQPQGPDARLVHLLAEQACLCLTPLTHHAPLGLPQEDCEPLTRPRCWPCYHHRWSWCSTALHDHNGLCPHLHLLLLLSLHPRPHLVDCLLPLSFLPLPHCLRLSCHLCPALLFHPPCLFCLPHFFCFSCLCQLWSVSLQQAICLLLISFCLRCSAFASSSLHCFSSAFTSTTSASSSESLTNSVWGTLDQSMG